MDQQQAVLISVHSVGQLAVSYLLPVTSCLLLCTDTSLLSLNAHEFLIDN